MTDSSRHTAAEIDECAKALEWAKQTGRARFVGVSSHDRPHLKQLIEKYPRAIEVVVTPYTAKTRIVSDEDGLWAAIKKHDVGWLGIKPFASNSVFKGDSSPNSPTREEDNRIARLAIRYILCNPAITAPIPGLISQQQVDNVALAVMERRELDTAEKAELERAMDRAWAGLPRLPVAQGLGIRVTGTAGPRPLDVQRDSAAWSSDWPLCRALALPWGARSELCPGIRA